MKDKNLDTKNKSLLKYVENKELRSYFRANIKEIVEIRRKLHKIPEIGFATIRTKEFLTKKLLNYGYELKEIAQNGLIAFKEGKSNREAVAFRADMDGLELNEDTGVEFSSVHPGKMHACGHDGHMTILLAFAKYISELKVLNRDIVFIFQPAEEGPGGAEVIVNKGVFNRYNIGAIFGLHIYPGLKEGKIGIKAGPLTAQSGEVDITLYGEGGHGAQPHQGKDSIFISSQLINNYQGIISRNLNPVHGGVLTIGKLESGTARNALAAKARLEGTIRSFNEDEYKMIKERIRTINKGIEKAHDVRIEMEIRDFYPPVVNDEKLYNMTKDVLNNKELIEMEPLMIAEDFAYYSQQTPAFFFMLGSKNKEKNFVYPLHNEKFNFSEAIIFKGISLYQRIAKRLKIT